MSSEFLRRLSVQLGIDTAVFEEGLHEVKHMFKETMEELTKSAVIDGELIAEGMKEAFESMKELGEEAIHHAGEMETLSEKYGISVETMSEFSYAARLSEADNEALAAGFRKLNDNMVKTAAGQGAAKDAFEVLGIKVKNANGEFRSTDEVLKDVADKFSSFENGATKTALAVDIFGKSGDALIPMLNEGRHGLEEMSEEAKKMGLVISGETAHSAKEFEDDLERVKMSMEGAATKVMTQMLPTFRNLSQQFVQNSADSEFLEGVAKTLEFTIKGLVSAGKIAWAVFKYLGDTIASVAAAIGEAAQGHFKQAWQILGDTKPIDDAGAALSGLADIWKEDAKAADAAAEAHKKAAPPDYQPGKKDKDKDKAEKERERAERELEAVQKLLMDKRQLEDADYAAQKAKVEAAVSFRILEQTDANKVLEGLAKHHKDVMDQIAKDEMEPLKQQQEKAKAEVEAAKKKFLDKRALEDADFAVEKARLESAVRLEVLDKSQGQLMIEQLTAAHKARLKEMDDKELEEKRRNSEMAVNFAQGSLDQIAQHSSGASKAAKALSKATALAKIAHDTPAAAMAAAQAVAGIPVIGPALAVAATVSMYALGAAAAANVLSDGGGGSSAGSSAAAVNASSVTPTASQPQQAPQQTILKVPEDALMTGRQLINYINDAMADGMQLTNLRVIPA